MLVGVPKEKDRHEHRVGLSPYAVRQLVSQGHSVLIEKGAGVTAHFTDHDYEKAGARVVYRTEEVFQRADLVCKVAKLTPAEVDLLKQDQVVYAFHHLAVVSRETVLRAMEKKVTLIGYEIIHDAKGDLPILIPFSEMAGQMVVHLAAYYLATEQGGRGVLLGSVPGIAPATVVILGPGTAGTSAARQAAACGAHVIVLGPDVERLRQLNRELGGRVVTVLAGTPERLHQYISIADVLIGAVLVPGARAPQVVTEEMVRAMKPGAVILDLSIDQGGCVATSRPTSPDNPTFIKHGVVHYCVPNMTASIPRTASRALANAVLPYLLAHGNKGLEQALRDDLDFGAGVYLYRGHMVNAAVGEVLQVPSTPLVDLLGRLT